MSKDNINNDNHNEYAKTIEKYFIDGIRLRNHRYQKLRQKLRRLEIWKREIKNYGK